jgi:hypothetical protein
MKTKTERMGAKRAKAQRECKKGDKGIEEIGG